MVTKHEDTWWTGHLPRQPAQKVWSLPEEVGLLLSRDSQCPHIILGKILKIIGKGSSSCQDAHASDLVAINYHMVVAMNYHHAVAMNYHMDPINYHVIANNYHMEAIYYT